MSDWLFNEAYRAQFDLPPTQQREVVKRLAKKNIVDVTATSDEIQAVLRAVHAAYSNKKRRARAASSKSRAAKREVDEVYCGGAVEGHGDAVVSCEPSVCDVAVACVAGAAAPQVAAPPTAAVAKPKSVKRADNIAATTSETQAALAPSPAPAPVQPKRPIAPTTRRGLCAMVAEVSLNAST